MSPIVEFRLRCSDLLLSPTLAAMPAAEIELVTEVATDPQRPYLCFWADGVDIEEFEREMAADPTISAIECYTEVDGRPLYRIQASEETDVVTYPNWVEAGVTLLGARWHDDWWHVRMRFPDRETLGELRGWSHSVGADLDLQRVYQDDGSTPGSSLTDGQREVLRTALDLGYFDIPREASMADVAAELDVSSQAVSERLRRGYRQLVAEHLR